jgi:putative hydrolase of the HAD superfamily
MIKVVGFDLDNTLYSQDQFEFEVFNKIAHHVNLDYGISSELYLNALKDVYADSITYDVFTVAIKRVQPTTPESWESYVKDTILPIYRNFYPSGLTAFKESLVYLEFLKSLKCKLVLITNGRLSTQTAKIDALKIEQYFDLILISDMYDSPKRKPNTFMFSEAIKHFNIASQDMLYIGDDIVLDGASETVGVKFIDISVLNLAKLKKEVL